MLTLLLAIIPLAFCSAIPGKRVTLITPFISTTVVPGLDHSGRCK